MSYNLLFRAINRKRYPRPFDKKTKQPYPLPPKKEKVRNDKKPQDERPWFKLCSKCELATVDVVCTACGELCDACDGVFHTRGAMAKHTRTPVPKPAPEEPEQKEQKGPLPKPSPL